MASNDAGPSAGPPTKAVVYKRYDPALIARDKRLSQLSNASSSTIGPGKANRRVLGSSTAPQAVSSVLSMNGTSRAAVPQTIPIGTSVHSALTPQVHVSAASPESRVEHTEETSKSSLPSSTMPGAPVSAKTPHEHATNGQLTPLNSGDYFAPAHTESTADRIVVRSLERERPGALSPLAETNSTSPKVNGHRSVASPSETVANGVQYAISGSPSGLPMVRSPTVVNTLDNRVPRALVDSSSLAWNGQGPPSNASVSSRDSLSLAQRSAESASAPQQEYRPLHRPRRLHLALYRCKGFHLIQAHNWLHKSPTSYLQLFKEACLASMKL